MTVLMWWLRGRMMTAAAHPHCILIIINIFQLPKLFSSYYFSTKVVYDSVKRSHFQRSQTFDNSYLNMNSDTKAKKRQKVVYLKKTCPGIKPKHAGQSLPNDLKHFGSKHNTLIYICTPSKFITNFR
jgi:hypothetical protein